MASAQVVETSVTNNSPSQDSNHPDDLFQSRNIELVSFVFLLQCFLNSNELNLPHDCNVFYCFSTLRCLRLLLLLTLTSLVKTRLYSVNDHKNKKKKKKQTNKTFPDGHLCCCHFFKSVYTYDFCGGKMMQFFVVLKLKF